MITDVQLQEKILLEIARLSQQLTNGTVPPEAQYAAQVVGIVINMLVSLLVEKIDIEEFLVLTMRISHLSIGLYYQEFFKEYIV